MPTKIQKKRCKSKKKSVKYNRPQGLQSAAAQELSIINCQLSIIN